MDRLTAHHEVSYPTEVKRTFADVSGIVGIPAIHGIEPYLIIASIGMRLNDQLEKNGSERKPIVLPMSKKYQKLVLPILRKRYAEHASEFFVSQELGDLLERTEFSGDYPAHLREVATKQHDVQTQLRQKMREGFSIQNLVTGEDAIFTGLADNQRLLFLNTGANVVGSQEGEAADHFIFPVLFDALLTYIEKNPNMFPDYDHNLIQYLLPRALDLRKHYKTTQIPKPGTMDAQGWFDHTGIIYTPPLKEREKISTTVTHDPEQSILHILREDNHDHTITTENVAYDPQIGGVYLNVSGSGIGIEEMKTHAEFLRKLGYVIFAPDWLANQIPDAVVGDPSFLNLKDTDGKPIIRQWFMRAGMGSVWEALVYNVISLYMKPGIKDNPEMFANIAELLKQKLGLVFEEDQTVLKRLESLEDNDSINVFLESVYEKYHIPKEMSGIDYTAWNIILAELGKRKIH